MSLSFIIFATTENYNKLYSLYINILIINMAVKKSKPTSRLLKK